MSLRTDYFRATDDDHAARAVRDGPGAPDPATLGRAYEVARLGGVEPFVMLGMLASLLAGRPYAEMTRHRRHAAVVAAQGDEGPWVVSVSDELVALLAAAAPAVLDDVAVRWSAAGGPAGTGPAELAVGLRALAALCAQADDVGHAVYCWTRL